MIKFVSPYAWEYGQPSMTHVKVASSGRLAGDDFNSFLKTAGDEAAFRAKKLEHHDGEELLHLLAMGSTETISPNRNGDGWKKAILIQSHPTFVKLAKLFRNHKSAKHDPYYGVVRDSWFNDRMGRVELLVGLNATKKAADSNRGRNGKGASCIADKELHMLDRGTDFPVSMSCTDDPNALVLTDLGYKRITDLKIGDLVSTHLGRWCRVNELTKRKYSGRMVRFKVNGLPTSFSLTANHPLFAKALNTGEMYPTHDQSKYRAAQWFERAEAGLEEPFSWLCVEHLCNHDRICYTPLQRIPGYGAIDNRDLAELLGIYLAEGSLGRNEGGNPCTLNLTVGSRDWAVRGVPQLIERIYPGVTCKIRPHPKSEKCLQILVYSTELCIFIDQMIGTRSANKFIPPEVFNADKDIKLSFLGRWLDGDGFIDDKGIHWSTFNYKLALQGRDLLASAGIAASIYHIDHTGQENQYSIKNGQEYTLNVSHLEAKQLLAFSDKVAKSNHIAEKPDVERTKPPCLRPVLDRYAYRIKEIETVDVKDVDVFNIEVEEDHSYSLFGLASHNCYVPFDFCSSCGNKAKKRAEYCRGTPRDHCQHGGLYKNAGRAFEDGHILHADNPYSEFFDISGIFDEDRLTPDRQADRIAYVMGRVKTAAASGAELAEELGVAPPLEIFGRTDYWVQKQARVLDAMTDQVSTPGISYEGTALPEVLGDSLFSKTSWSILSKLAASRVCLSLTDFAKLCNAEDPSGLAKRAEPYAESALERLAKQADIGHLLAHNPFRFNTDHPDSGKALFSLDPVQVQRRTWLESLRPSVKQASIEDPHAEALSDIHALYRVGLGASLSDTPEKLALLFSGLARHTRA